MIPIPRVALDAELSVRTSLGTASIEVYGLNRVDLVLGRSNAFHSRKLILCGAHSQLRQGRLDEATLGLSALVQEPFASVLYAMLQLLDSPDVMDILSQDVVSALRDPVVLGILRPLAGATAQLPAN